jgi:soluble lytic murein transglycosylase-like protein
MRLILSVLAALAVAPALADDAVRAVPAPSAAQTKTPAPTGAMSESLLERLFAPRSRFGTRTEPAKPSAAKPQSAYPWDGAMDAAIARHAAANGVPIELARRVVMRESSGNPRAVSQGNYGLMQIRLGTAQAMGYRGGAQGLLDAETNMTYAMRYLAGALRAARGDHDRAVALYARGYYPEAKAMGFSPYDPPRAASLVPLGWFGAN